MATKLSEVHCEACRADAPRVGSSEAQALLQEIPHWQLVDVAGIEQLHRTFTFKNFVDAMSFTNKVAELAEAEGHHPALTTEWGKVGVAWWTHKIKGLHRNDFVMSAKTDQLYDQ